MTSAVRARPPSCPKCKVYISSGSIRSSNLCRQGSDVSPSNISMFVEIKEPKTTICRFPSVHSSGLANKRRYITVLVTGRHGDDLLKDYIRSDRDLVMHLIDLRYSGLESRGRGITEAATDHNCSRPQHTTGYEPANRVPAENDPSETFSDGDSAPPLSLAEIKRMQTMGILPLPHGLSSVMFCPAEVPPTTARAMPPLTALPGSYR